jgi:hypothetical protein
LKQGALNNIAMSAKRPRERVRKDLPQEGSPLDPLVPLLLGVSGPVTDDGGVLGEGLAEALGDGFVVALKRAGD